MKALFWVIGGFVLLTLSNAIEAVGDTGASPGERLPTYFLALAVLLAAGFCFVKAGRVLWDNFTGKNRGSGTGGTGGGGPSGGARPARRLSDPLSAVGSDKFDADAAFARYMERRGKPEQQACATGQSAPAPQARGFGRKNA